MDLERIRDAARRIAGSAHRTPVITSATLDAATGQKLFFKCENLQRVGAFKFRGAFNAVMRLSEEQAARGVVTHSSGNHAQALALAARLRGVTAHVVMPKTALASKRRATQGYGAILHECEPTLVAREATADRVAEQTGGVQIPPFDHPDVIAGQGTILLELVEQVPGIKTVVAPIGGGGLISGIALAAHALDPDFQVIGAEPQGADDAFRSKKRGELVPQEDPRTIADGLRTSLGALTWPVVRDLVERIITVSEDEIIAALRLVWERMKLVVEPSAAVAVAAVLRPEFRALGRGAPIGVVLSGGNVDLDSLPALFVR